MPGHVEQRQLNLPTVAIVGRPNVGKSTLFNRILRRRLSIEASESGVTRDRVSAVAAWRNRPFLVIDTGGLGLYRGEKGGEQFDAQIRDQLLAALADADHVVLVTDATSGITPLDQEVANIVRQLGCPVTVAANKSDNPAWQTSASEFAQLGFPEVIPTSCTHKINIDALLDRITEEFPERDPGSEEAVIHIAIVGKPNVGKSSIVNRFLGQERVIVSDVPGTTRDAVDIPILIDLDGMPRHAVLIDTAGMRHRTHVKDMVEHFSTERTKDAIVRADVIIICIDASEPVSVQDKRLCRMVYDAGKPCLILANKWDIACQDIKRKELLARLAYDLPFMEFAPIITCCAISGYSFSEIMPTVVHLQEQQKIEIPTSVVNQVLKDLQVRMPAPAAGTGVLKIYYGVYKGGTPPTFLLFVNRAENCHEHYRSFLRNQLREAFGMIGLPIVIELRNRHNAEANAARYAEIKKGLKAKKPRHSSSKKRDKRR